MEFEVTEKFLKSFEGILSFNGNLRREGRVTFVGPKSAPEGEFGIFDLRRILHYEPRAEFFASHPEIYLGKSQEEPNYPKVDAKYQ